MPFHKSRKCAPRLKGGIVTTARSNLRWQTVRDISDQGGTIEEAAERIGKPVKFVQSLIYRRVGTQAWPIVEPKL